LLNTVQSNSERSDNAPFLDSHKELLNVQTIDDLKNRIPQIGRLEWIGTSSGRKSSIQSKADAVVVVGSGIEGDHHATSGNGDSKRQVTMIQSEHLSTIAEFLGRDRITPETVRRNLVISGVNLIALKDKRFQIGEVILEGTGPCAPCSRMEENLGPGGFNAMRGHGGITARVLSGGKIKIGDTVRFVEDEPTDDA
jgi:MOSC domain-containing protein YiiM